jgi:Thioesterase-like superfamily
MWSAHEMMISSGSWDQAGPSSAWFRLRCPVVDDEPPTPAERVAAAADFGSGVGNPLPFVHASAINPEVTIHLYRHPAGDWVCLESGGWAADNGVGMVETRLHDEQGPIGRAVQTLLVEPMRPGAGRERP